MEFTKQALKDLKFNGEKRRAKLEADRAKLEKVVAV
jgi:hypothetical protein